MHETNPVYMTEEGLQQLQEELDELINVRRPALAERLHFAIKQGDLSENADYIQAKEEQGFLEGRILELQEMLRNAQIIRKSAVSSGLVELGSHVTVREEGTDEREVYHLVGPTEANPARGKISYVSPLGKALLGHKVGDEVAVSAPAGEIRFEILAVE